ncbi:Transcriptional regulatory protein CusR (plasmid) [Klebsiella pneumoniae]|nr:Transcriptional regulatory protein CusR [Klebsiella pneumoniae]CAH6272740.1 Transcriptional regulatory protein CusR [Klebsiella pneumoniae]
MKILIVEDEIKTGEYLSKGLTEAGFVVDHADNGLTGYHLAMTAEYDLVILDIMLPDVNGWDIIRMLRSAGKGMPVLLLTALGTIEHRVKGLELGADDYLVKPFAFAELLARVRTLLRRGNTMITESQLKGHCCKVSDEAAFCLIQRPYISKTLLTRRISPRGSP